MAKRRSPRSSSATTPKTASTYTHPTAELSSRPEIGTQAQFQKKKPPKTYKYDSSISPALDWDGQNAVRERGEALIRQIVEAKTIEEARNAAEELARLSKPFLNWAGKAERLSFDVPTLPMFVHERLSTKAILETLKTHQKDQQEMLDLFGDPRRSITDQVLRAYEHKDRWVNRIILGDSLVVMNSLLEYEGLGGQVQMIYIDPPYGVKFGSNFQPFVRKRDVKHNDDTDMTREPEMVQAYRDTWELGLHSYLTYLRDRLLVTRELLAPSGSVFVQISDANLHHVRELLDEVFGADNFVAQVNFKSTSALGQKGLRQAYDYIVWFARDATQLKFRALFKERDIANDREWRYVDDQEADRGFRKLTEEEFIALKDYSGLFRRAKLTSSGFTPSCIYTFELDGVTCRPFGGKSWLTTKEGMERLRAAGRLFVLGKNPYSKQYYRDFPVVNYDNSWPDQPAAEERAYVVQTANKFVQRCMLMTTDPGDLVLDPTCGSGTTAYVAEQWGRRWITIDTSRVPLALARQRILTATFLWYELVDEARGPAGGFAYKRKQNTRGEEVGGIVPHMTLKSIANDEPPKEEVLVDRPEQDSSITRVSGPLVVEATIPTPVNFDEDGGADSTTAVAVEHGSFVERMLDVVRRSPNIQIGGGKIVTLRNIRPPARALSLSAEAIVDASAHGQSPTLADVVDESEERRGDRLPLSGRPVAIAFGPENGAVSEKLVFNAAKEANARNYTHLYVIGFAIQPNAREMIETAEAGLGIVATYVQMTPDIMMGDLLKNLRSSQIFSVCGLPDIELVKIKKKQKPESQKYMVRLLGIDVFDPISNEVQSVEGNDVPCWMLDTNYNELCFHVSQAFFPRTGAWENLRKALRADYEQSVWDHLNGAESTPFEGGDDTRIAVKVIDRRGNELMVVRRISEAITQ